MATKRELEDKKEYARVLFMAGERQNIIAEKVGVSETTLSKWVNVYGWNEQRGALNITRPELVNKLLRAIDTLLDKVNASDDPDAIANVGDKLVKLSSTIDKLDRKATIVDVMEAFMAFVKWLQARMSFDSELTPELLKIINMYQDLYINDLSKTR